MDLKTSFRNLLKVTEEEQLIDMTDIIVFVGILLLVVGIGGFDWRIASIIAGALLLMLVRPLSTWIK